MLVFFSLLCLISFSVWQTPTYILQSQADIACVLWGTGFYYADSPLDRTQWKCEAVPRVSYPR